MWSERDVRTLVEAGFYEMSADADLIRTETVRALR